MNNINKLFPETLKLILYFHRLFLIELVKKVR